MSWTKKISQAFLFLHLLTGIRAQLPKTDLYLLDIQGEQVPYAIQKLRYVSGFNPNGYNNQPVFISQDELYFSSDAYHPKQKTDIWSLSFNSNTCTKVTNDVGPVYSPTPRFHELDFTTVTVHYQNSLRDTLQQLWAHSLSTRQRNTPQLLFDSIQNVGYHCWTNQNDLVLWLLEPPDHALYLFDVKTGKKQLIARNPGRCIKLNETGMILYVQKQDSGPSYLKLLNPMTRQTSTIAKTLEGSEDFCILPGNRICMAKGGRIYLLDSSRIEEWVEMINLEDYGIRQIGRLACTGSNRIALVNTKP